MVKKLDSNKYGPIPQGQEIVFPLYRNFFLCLGKKFFLGREKKNLKEGLLHSLWVTV